MRRLIIFLILPFTFATKITQAQGPMEFNYQAVARDIKGIPLAEKNIQVRFSIHHEKPEGRVEYSEVRKLRTNPFGMFSVSVGSTDAYMTTGTLMDVDWKNGRKYLQVEVDFTGDGNYLDLGAPQIVSVPYALMALKSLDSLTAGEGMEIKNGKIQLGVDSESTSNALQKDRYIPLNSKSLILKDGPSSIGFSKESITIQQDSAFTEENKFSGGIFFKSNPLFPRADAVPFMFTRAATQQNNGQSSPNEVVMWGHNLNPGGGAYISGLPAIGYSMESNYRPYPEKRLVESHEYYVAKNGRQIRLKSYTIDTDSDYVDFFHSTDNLYIKNPRNGDEYFRVYSTMDQREQHLWLGNVRVLADRFNNQVRLISSTPKAELILKENWRQIYLPGMFLEDNETIHITGNLIFENDNKNIIGSFGSRVAEVNSLYYRGGRMILKEKWEPYQNLQATAVMDIEGDKGFNQLRLRKSYTPTSSNDPNGNTGDVSWDENYLYIKTTAGWKRTALSDF